MNQEQQRRHYDTSGKNLMVSFAGFQTQRVSHLKRNPDLTRLQRRYVSLRRLYDTTAAGTFSARHTTAVFSFRNDIDQHRSVVSVVRVT